MALGRFPEREVWSVAELVVGTAVASPDASPMGEELGSVAIIALIFLGGQVSKILSTGGNSVQDHNPAGCRPDQ